MAEFRLGFDEKPFQIYYLDVLAFIATADVSNYLTGQVAVTLQNRNGWNTASLTLTNAEDTFVWTPEQALTIRNVLENGGTVDESKFRTAVTDFRYSEKPKLKVAKLKSQGPKVKGANSKDKETGAYRWPCDPHCCIFNKLDPIRIFLHNPIIAEQDMTTPAWIPIFAGFVENRTLDEDYVGVGPRLIQITAYDVRYFLHRMRVDVNGWSGSHAGNPLIQITDSLFKDIHSGSRFGHPLPGKTFEEITQSLILGGVVKVDPNTGKATGKPVPPRKQYQGAGFFRFGQIFFMTPADPPSGAAPTSNEQLAPNTSETAKRDKAIATAQAKLDAAKKAQADAEKKEAASTAAVTAGGTKVDAAKQMEMAAARTAADKARAETRAAQSELSAAQAGTSSTPMTSSADARAAAASAAKASAIQEPTTELKKETVSQLESWYALGLFGDWEDDLRRATSVPTAETAEVIDSTATGAAPPSGGQAPAGTVTQASTPSAARDPVTGAVKEKSQGTFFYDPNATIKDGKVVTPSPVAQSQQTAQQTQARAATGAGASPAGDPATSAGPATNRPLTYKEVLVIGLGTFWGLDFCPDTQKLYYLLPKKGTGNSQYADSTTGLNPGFHDRSWISRHEIIINTCSAIDYQWWVSGSGDMFFEPNMLDFQPDDFGSQFAPCMKVDRHLIKGTIGEEIGDIPSAIQAVGSLGLTNKQAPGPLNTVRSAVFFPNFVRRYGIGVESRSYPFVHSKKTLEALAMTDLQKAVAHANQSDISFGYRPFLLPNKPLLNRVRTRLGTTTAVSHTLVIHREATTRASQDWVRSLRADGRWVLITGGFDAPITGRRILPVDTIYGPPRNGARTSLDVANDPNVGIADADPSSEKSTTVNDQVAVETK